MVIYAVQKVMDPCRVADESAPAEHKYSHKLKNIFVSKLSHAMKIKHLRLPKTETSSYWAVIINLKLAENPSLFS
jgi:hypothetical protein